MAVNRHPLIAVHIGRRYATRRRVDEVRFHRMMAGAKRVGGRTILARNAGT